MAMNYMERIMTAWANGVIPKGSLVMPQIQHQKKCRWEKGRCNCIPDISIETEDGYIELDEEGKLKKKI